MKNYTETRDGMASVLKQTPKEERAEKLAELRKTPEYLVAYYSRREGEDLTAEEIADRIYNETTTSSLRKEQVFSSSSADLDKLLLELSNSLGATPSQENSNKIIELKKKIFELFTKLTSSLQERYSEISKTKVSILDIKAARILYKSLEDKANSQIDILERLSYEDQNESQLAFYRSESSKSYRYKDRAGACYVMLKAYESALMGYEFKKDELERTISRYSPVLEQMNILSINSGSIVDRGEFFEVPRDYIKVYQRVPNAVIPSIDQNGLLNYSNDGGRNFPDMRYSFAFLNPLDANLNNPYNDSKMLEMMVDPKRCLVLSIQSLGNIRPFMEIYEFMFNQGMTESEMDNPTLKRLLNRLNTDLISYHDYQKFYHKSAGFRMSNQRMDLPEFILSPVVVHIGIIPSRFIRVPDSSETNK